MSTPYVWVSPSGITRLDNGMEQVTYDITNRVKLGILRDANGIPVGANLMADEQQVPGTAVKSYAAVIVLTWDEAYKLLRALAQEVGE